LPKAIEEKTLKVKKFSVKAFHQKSEGVNGPW